MTRKSPLLCVLPLIWQTAAFGQANQPVVRADLDQLKADILTEMRMTISQALTRQGQQPDANMEPVKAVPDCCDELRKEVTALKETQQEQGVLLGELEALRIAQSDQGEMLRQITMQSEPGNFHVRFDTNSQSGRHELQRAIKSTMPERGDFVIRNRTNRDEWIVVNGTQYLVLAGAELPLKVSPGTVTARLRNQRQPLALHIGFPNYFQSVDIKEPANTWVYYSQPVYTAAPSWAAAY